MSSRDNVLTRFTADSSPGPLYLPDLSLWYAWHTRNRTLPDPWQGLSLVDIARGMGVPVWLPIRPWWVETPNSEIELTEQHGERLVRTTTPSGSVQARWTLGPDGDWWQVEYPVKKKEDLPIALEAVEDRSYILEPSALMSISRQVGVDGIVALELPKRPYSELLHELLGWSDGLMLLAEPEIAEILAVLEIKLRKLVEGLAALPGHIIFSPDNLDGMFISPRAFGQHLAASYSRTADLLHTHGKHLLVHVGGAIRHLLLPLAEAGVDGIQGICGPPQSNATLTEARNAAGSSITLWGGIPQDVLLEAHSAERFESDVRSAAREALGDSRMILGIADRVPIGAIPSRLAAVPELVGSVG